MTLVLEDGTGKTDANAFVYGLTAPTGAPAWALNAVRYWVDRGRGSVRNADGEVIPRSQWSTTSKFRVGSTDYTNDQINSAIVRATFYLSESFQWKGQRVNGRRDREGFQALAFPRHDIVDREGHYVDDDEIPREVLWATAEIAFQELREPNAIASPTFDQNKIVQQVRAGSAQVTFDTDKVSASGVRRKLPIVADLIGEFLAAGAGNSLVGSAVRG